MSVLATFVGGPLDGEQRALRAPLSTLEFPRRPPLVSFGREPGPLLPLPPYVYDREAPPVEGEAVYRWRP